jgi:hypothetical protein
MQFVFFVLGLIQVLVLFAMVIALIVLAVRGAARAVLGSFTKKEEEPPKASPATHAPTELARATVPTAAPRRFIP